MGLAFNRPLGGPQISSVLIGRQTNFFNINEMKRSEDLLQVDGDGFGEGWIFTHAELMRQSEDVLVGSCGLKSHQLHIDW